MIYVIYYAIMCIKYRVYEQNSVVYDIYSLSYMLFMIFIDCDLLIFTTVIDYYWLKLTTIYDCDLRLWFTTEIDSPAEIDPCDRDFLCFGGWHIWFHVARGVCTG